jgi:hypothetical protein
MPVGSKAANIPQIQVKIKQKKKNHKKYRFSDTLYLLKQLLDNQYKKKLSFFQFIVNQSVNRCVI